MSITLVALDEANRGALHTHLRESRSLDWTDARLEEFVDWRYFARQDADTLLAVTQGRCVAMIDSLVRDYGETGSRHRVRETAEWSCQPQYRAMGLGLQVLRRMMRRQEPILAVRGTDETQALLPRLGWTRLPDVVLLNANLDWSRRARDLASSLSGFFGVHGTDSRDFLAKLAVPTAADLETLASCASVFTPLLGVWEIEWFARAPHEAGEFFWVRLERQGRGVGIALARVYRARGQVRGKVIHAASADPAGLVPLLTGVVREFRRRSVARVAARASAPTTVTAYRACGFGASARTHPVFWWRGAGAFEAPKNTDLSYLRGDDSVRPFAGSED